MKLSWHRQLETGDDFLGAAPFRYVNSVEMSTPPEQTWEALTTDDTGDVEPFGHSASLDQPAAVRWTLALEPTPPLMPILRMCAPITSRTLRHVLRGLPRSLHQGPQPSA